MSAKKKLTVKKKKRISLAPKPAKDNEGKNSIKWDESPVEEERYDEENVAEVDPDDVEFIEGLSLVEEKQYRFYCYRCGQRLKVPLSWAKKIIECGRCARKIIIPPPLEEDQ